MLACRHSVLKKENRILHRRDFLFTARSGVIFRTKFFVVQGRKTDRPSFRVGVTASKKVGCSVFRNRCKRRLRSLARLIVDPNVIGVDYVFIANKNTRTAKWDQMLEAARRALNGINESL